MLELVGPAGGQAISWTPEGGYSLRLTLGKASTSKRFATLGETQRCFICIAELTRKRDQSPGDECKEEPGKSEYELCVPMLQTAWWRRKAGGRGYRSQHRGLSFNTHSGAGVRLGARVKPK